MNEGRRGLSAAGVRMNEGRRGLSAAGENEQRTAAVCQMYMRAVDIFQRITNNGRFR